MGTLVMELDLIEEKVSSKFRQNVLIFGVDMSSPAHTDNKKKKILVLGIGPTQGLEHTLTAEKMYSINFMLQITNVVSVCITMGKIVTYLFMVQKYKNLKQKILKFSRAQYVLETFQKTGQ